MSARESEDTPVTAALVIIGDEILSGRTEDANLPVIARWLGERGVRLAEARIVPDRHAAIAEAVNATRRLHDYVFTTGGIGPTHDDITAEAVAQAFDRPLRLHEEAYRRLQAHYPPGEFTEARQRMARVPEGGELIDNPVSVAPGFRLDNVYVLAGVPEIVEVMLDSLAHTVTGGAPMRSKSLGVALPESAFADALGRIQRAYPDVQIGSYPFYHSGGAGLHVVMRSTDEAVLEQVAAEVAGAARAEGVEPVEDPGEA